MRKLTLYNVQKEVADGLNGAHITFDSIFRAATERILCNTTCFQCNWLHSTYVHTNTDRTVCFSTLENALTAATTITRVLSTKPLEGDTYSAVGDEHHAISVVYTGFAKLSAHTCQYVDYILTAVYVHALFY